MYAAALAKKMNRFVLESLHFFAWSGPTVFMGEYITGATMQRGFVAVQSSQSKPLLPNMTEVLLHKWVGQGTGQRAHLGSLWYIDAP